LFAAAAAPSLEVTQEVVDGPAVPALLERAGDGLLVVGEQGASGLGGALVGSVASTVAAHAAGPVVVVRGEVATDATAPVVVGVDGSPAGEAAVDVVVAVADAEGCPLVAVHTWWDPLVDSVPEAFVDLDAITDDERRVLAEQLAGRSATHPDLEVSTVVVRSRAVPALLEQARGARLLVVGHAGPRRLRRAAAGVGEPRAGASGAVPGRRRAPDHGSTRAALAVVTPSAGRPCSARRGPRRRAR
jgi:nucleotide-binding universal stress UspA family protein